MKSIQREKWSENRAEIYYFKILKYVFRYFDFYKAQNSCSAKNIQKKTNSYKFKHKTIINLELINMLTSEQNEEATSSVLSATFPQLHVAIGSRSRLLHAALCTLFSQMYAF